VVLHRDQEDFPPAPIVPIVSIVSVVSIVSPVVGMGGEAAPRQRTAESQRTREPLMSHL
jgi:hypothetical protein